MSNAVECRGDGLDDILRAGPKDRRRFDRELDHDIECISTKQQPPALLAYDRRVAHAALVHAENGDVLHRRHAGNRSGNRAGDGLLGLWRLQCREIANLHATED